MMTFSLDAIVEDYKKTYPNELDDYMQYCKDQKDIAKAIEYAAIAIKWGTKREKGNLEKHQWRLKASLLDEFAMKLIAQKNEIEKARDFDELYEIINNEKIKGIGELVVYDTASRIGARINKLPNDKIYLHAGVKQGVKNLRLKSTGKYILIPEIFKKYNLKAHQIEDILCIYKDCFPDGNSNKCVLNPAFKRINSIC